jgi:hypothetical protein
LSASKMFATGAPDPTASSKALPHADQSYGQPQADVTAEWAADARKRMPERHQSFVPGPVLGLNFALPTRTESQQPKKATLVGNLSASLDSVLATHADAIGSAELAPSATASMNSPNEPSVPATSHGPAADFLRSPLGRVELPPGLAVETVKAAANQVKVCAERHDHALPVESPATVLAQMPVRPTAAAAFEASAGVSYPERRIPVSPAVPPAEPVNQPSLTDVLSKYFGAPLNARVIGKLPATADPPAGLEA